MAWNDLRPWGIKWRYIALALFALMLLFGGKKATDTPNQSAEIRIPSGTLEAEYPNIKGRPFNVAMWGGRFENRANDIEELAKDWLHLRKKILDLSAAGDERGAKKAREDFKQVNRFLEQYDPRDVAFIIQTFEGK